MKYFRLIDSAMQHYCPTYAQILFTPMKPKQWQILGKLLI